jgi:NAD(P)-dependent dehydrogenase (short-subunit alcohol dehydrogenase family)
MAEQAGFGSDLFAGATVFVTGGGSGINLGIARTFASLGADIGICGRTVEKLEAARSELEALGTRTFTAAVDVRDADALERAVTECEAALGPMSVLVCGAAGNFPCPAEQLSPNGFKAVVDIDLNGSFNACRAAFSQLCRTRGSIILISAGQAFVPYPAQVHVCAAKAGVDQMMRVLALEWGQYGIRCNSIAPGPIEGTEGMRRLAPEDDSLRPRLEAAIPLGRYGTSEDIGWAAAFLASPLASYVTGTVLVVDGGQNLAGSGTFSELIRASVAGSHQAGTRGARSTHGQAVTSGGER